jgi:hypothetical protein
MAAVQEIGARIGHRQFAPSLTFLFCECYAL